MFNEPTENSVASGHVLRLERALLRPSLKAHETTNIYETGGRHQTKAGD